MKPIMLIPPNVAGLPQLAAQMGIKSAVTKATSELSGLLPPYDFDSLKKIRENFRECGVNLCGLEGDQFDMSPIKLGLPDRDEWIERYAQMVRNMGRLGGSRLVPHRRRNADKRRRAHHVF